MKAIVIILFFIIDFIFHFTTSAQPVGAKKWQKLLGGAGNDYATCVEPTSDGGCIIAGSSDSSSTGTLTDLTNNGEEDAWIVKLDENGVVQWQKLFGGSRKDKINSIQPTSDNGYIMVGKSESSNTGTFSGLFNNGGFDLWIIKLNKYGNIEWQKLLGGNSDDEGMCIRQTIGGGYIISANSNSSKTGSLKRLGNHGQFDIWILKITDTGAVQWEKLFGGKSDEKGSSIQQTDDRGYIIAGSASSSNTGTLAGLVMNGLTDAWVLKLDSAGKVQWQKLLGSNNISKDDIREAISVQQVSNRYIIAGNSHSVSVETVEGAMLFGLAKFGGWIAELNSSGGINWYKRLGDSTTGYVYNIYSMQRTVDYGYIIAGSCWVNNNEEFWIIKLATNGESQWENLLGGTKTDKAQSICETRAGGYIAVGNSESSDTGVLAGLTNHGKSDIWILKMNGIGNTNDSDEISINQWRLEVPKSVNIWWDTLPAIGRVLVVFGTCAILLIFTVLFRLKLLLNIAMLCFVGFLIATFMTKNMFWALIGIILLVSIVAGKAGLKQSRRD